MTNKKTSGNEILICDDGSIVKPLKKNASIFKDKLTILFGPSESGKSTILDEILFYLKEDIPIAMAIVPTDAVNGGLSKRLGKPIVHTDFNKMLMENLFNRQGKVMQIYNKVNNINVQRKLFNKFATSRERKYEQYVLQEYKYAVQKINAASYEKSFKVRTKRSLEYHKDERLSLLYTTTIRIKRNRYAENMEMLKLSKEDAMIMKFLDFNPRILLVLDDCAAGIKKWSKDEKIRKVFFEGRHFKITSIYTFQDDKTLDSELRKQAFVNVFTTPQVANAYFERKANSFTKEQRLRARAAINVVFDKDIPYRKLVYIRKEDAFYHNQSEMYGDKEFVFGCKAYWEFINRVSNQEENVMISELF